MTIAEEYEDQAQKVLDKAKAELFDLVKTMEEHTSIEVREFRHTIDGYFSDLMGDTFSGAVYRQEA